MTPKQRAEIGKTEAEAAKIRAETLSINVGTLGRLLRMGVLILSIVLALGRAAVQQEICNQATFVLKQAHWCSGRWRAGRRCGPTSMADSSSLASASTCFRIIRVP